LVESASRADRGDLLVVVQGDGANQVEHLAPNRAATQARKKRSEFQPLGRVEEGLHR
jgi:hypothetical protein